MRGNDMASGRVTLTAATWVNGSDGASLLTSSFNFQNLQGRNIRVMGTVANTAPTSDAGALTCEPYCGTNGSVTLEELFPGQGFEYIWFYSTIAGEVSFYHD